LTVHEAADPQCIRRGIRDHFPLLFTGSCLQEYFYLARTVIAVAFCWGVDQVLRHEIINEGNSLF